MKPDLDLSLGETKCVGDLDASATSQVSVKVEFFFELENLMLGVGGAGTLAVQIRDTVTTIGTYTHT